MKIAYWNSETNKQEERDITPDEVAQMQKDAEESKKQPIPDHITMRQARLVLLGIGKLAVVDAAINSLPEPHKSGAKITWEYSTEVQRKNGLVSQLASALGLTESQIDELFIAGAKL